MNVLIIATAKYLFVVSILIVSVYWLKIAPESKKRLALIIILSGLLALILAKLGGALISDPRPFVVGHFSPLIPHASDNGFPSDHTLLTSLLGFALLPFSKRLGGLLLVIALAVGAARVAAGIHHPLDVVGSFVITAVSAACVWYGMKHPAKPKAESKV